MPVRARTDRRPRRLTRPAAALAGGLVIALVPACSATSAGPAPFSASPGPSVIGSVVAPIPSSAAPATTAPAPPATAASPTKGTPSTTATAATTPAAVGALRTSYPGIKKLVIVKSRWNNTPAGRAVINAIADYNSGLATAVAAKSTKHMRSLFTASCAACTADVTRLDGIVAKHQYFVQSGGSVAWTSIAIFIKSRISAQTYLVAVDENAPELVILAHDGSVVSRAAPVAYQSTYTVAKTSAGYQLISYSDDS